MANIREFKVVVEKELKVTLDMDKYDKQTLDQLRSIWGDNYLDFTDEEMIEESVSDLANTFMRDGYLDEELEEFPTNGQKCIETNVRLDVEEIK